MQVAAIGAEDWICREQPAGRRDEDLRERVGQREDTDDPAELRGLHQTDRDSADQGSDGEAAGISEKDCCRRGVKAEEPQNCTRKHGSKNRRVALAEMKGRHQHRYQGACCRARCETVKAIDQVYGVDYGCTPDNGCKKREKKSDITSTDWNTQPEGEQRSSGDELSKQLSRGSHARNIVGEA